MRRSSEFSKGSLSELSEVSFEFFECVRSVSVFKNHNAYLSISFYFFSVFKLLFIVSFLFFNFL